MITARIDQRDINKLIADLERKAKRVPRVLADESAVIMRENSAASKDIRGRKLAEYSAGYKKWRQAHGLSTTVDLRVKGDLLDRPDVKANGTKSSVSPNVSDLMKANGIQPKRKLYPETEADMSKHIPRLVRAGERAMQ